MQFQRSNGRFVRRHHIMYPHVYGCFNRLLCYLLYFSAVVVLSMKKQCSLSICCHWQFCHLHEKCVKFGSAYCGFFFLSRMYSNFSPILCWIFCFSRARHNAGHEASPPIKPDANNSSLTCQGAASPPKCVHGLPNHWNAVGAIYIIREFVVMTRWSITLITHSLFFILVIFDPTAIFRSVCHSLFYLGSYMDI